MFTALKAIPWTGLCLIALAVMLFFGGYHYKGLQVQVQTLRLNTDLGQAKATIRQQQDQILWERNYAAQLKAAAEQAVVDRTELARLRASPRHSVVCVNTPGYTALPGLPAPAPDEAASGGVLPQSAGLHFNPTEQLYDLADEADSAVETAREALAKWPQ